MENKVLRDHTFENSVNSAGNETPAPVTATPMSLRTLLILQVMKLECGIIDRGRV